MSASTDVDDWLLLNIKSIPIVIIVSSNNNNPEAKIKFYPSKTNNGPPIFHATTIFFSFSGHLNIIVPWRRTPRNLRPYIGLSRGPGPLRTHGRKGPGPTRSWVVTPTHTGHTQNNISVERDQASSPVIIANFSWNYYQS